MLRLPFFCLTSAVCWTFWEKVCVCVCVCVRVCQQFTVKEEKQQTSKYLSTNYSQVVSCPEQLCVYVCVCV